MSVSMQGTPSSNSSSIGKNIITCLVVVAIVGVVIVVANEKFKEHKVKDECKKNGFKACVHAVASAAYDTAKEVKPVAPCFAQPGSAPCLVGISTVLLNTVKN